MRKIFFLAWLAFFFVMLFFPYKRSIIYASNFPYAKITKTGVAFYNQPVEKEDSLVFYLEVSYYVQLLEEENNGFFKAKYMDQVGYVLKKHLSFVKGVPQNPYPVNIGFTVYSFEGLHMRSSPTRQDGHFNIVVTLNFMENNLTYYGKKNGEQAVPDKTNIWYYAKYTNPTNGTEFKGYVYSEFCYKLGAIALNTETLEEISEPNFSKPTNPSNNSNNFLNLSKELQIILVLGVSLPCLGLIYFLFKPTKISLDVGKNKTKKLKKIKNSDYFEFED